MALEFVEAVGEEMARPSSTQPRSRGRMAFEPLEEGETGAERIGKYAGSRVRSFGERAASGIKPALETAGALTVGAMAAPGGPAAMAGGATLGAMGGSHIYDIARNALISAGVLSGEPKAVTEQMERAAGAGESEALGTLGVPALARAWVLGKSKVLGVTEDAARLADDARERGINLGVSDVSEAGLPRGYEKVVGVFPIAGSPIRKAAERRVQEVAAAQDRLVSGIGDVHSLTDVGEELTAGAKRQFDLFRQARDKKYGEYRRLAAESSATIPTYNIQEAAQKFVSGFDNQRSAYVGRADGGQFSKEELEAFKEPVFIEQARRMQTLQPKLTVDQYEGLMNDFDAALFQSRKDGFNFKNIDTLRRAAKEDFSNISDPRVKTAKELADQWFQANIAKFETPTAKKFGRVDKNMFDVGFEQSGSLNADEVFSAAFNTKSPKAMRDLRSLVGEAPMRNAVASYIENAYDSAIVKTAVGGKEVPVIDPEKFRSAIGLARANSSQWKTLDAALKESGSEIRAADLDRFVKAVEAAVGRNTPNPATFVARRAVMGGAGAVESALPLGASFMMGSPWPLAAFWMARQGSKKLTDPKHLQDITDLIHPATGERYKEAIAGRLMKGIALEGGLDAAMTE